MVRVNNKFEINFDTNEIITMDNRTSLPTKVEPRIMQVLEILIRNSPNVVSRDQLISEVWNNYGGADDALNQSISHLRKLLHDKDKENRIIETVVKKGYRFKDKKYTDENMNLVDKRIYKSSKFWVVLIILISVTILFYILNNRESFAPEAPNNAKSNIQNISAHNIYKNTYSYQEVS